MPETARRRRPLDTGGPWGSGLLATGLGSLMIGGFYVLATPGSTNPAMAWMGHTIVVMFGTLWVVAGLFCIVRALMPPQRHWHLIPVVALMCATAGVYLAHWIVFRAYTGEWGHDWESALVWGLFAAVLIEFGRCVNPPGRSRR